MAYCCNSAMTAAVSRQAMVIHQGKFMTAFDTPDGAQRSRVAFSPGLPLNTGNWH